MGIEITTTWPPTTKPSVPEHRRAPRARVASAEYAMEWDDELINGYKGGDARATRSCVNSRNIVVPIVNPDGFEARAGGWRTRAVTSP